VTLVYKKVFGSTKVVRLLQGRSVYLEKIMKILEVPSIGALSLDNPVFIQFTYLVFFAAGPYVKDEKWMPEHLDNMAAIKGDVARAGLFGPGGF